MLQLAGPFSSGVAVGVNGSATANKDTSTVIRGLIRGIYVDYLDSPPAATTDIEIKTSDDNHPEISILAISNAATSGLFLPKKESVSQVGGANSGDFDLIPVFDYLNISIAGANAGDSVDVFLFIEGS